MGAAGRNGRRPQLLAEPPPSMTALVVFCLWFGCPDPAPEPLPAHTHEVAPRATAATVVDNTYRGMGSDVEQWRGLVSQHFSDVDLALCVLEHESGGNPNARNATSGAAGLFQIMPFWWDAYGGDRYDPATNVALAAVIHADYGWGAWSAYNRGKC